MAAEDIHLIALLAHPSEGPDEMLDIITVERDRNFIGKAERTNFFWLRCNNLSDVVRNGANDTASNGSRRFTIPLSKLMEMVVESNAGIYALTEISNGRNFQAHIQTDLVSGQNLVVRAVASASNKVYDKVNGVFVR